MSAILVKELMDFYGLRIQENTSVAETINILSEAQQCGAPVIDDEGYLVGYITEKTCNAEIANDVFFCEDSISIRDIMSYSVKMVRLDDPISKVANMMANAELDHFPVVESGQLVGVISSKLVLETLLQSKAQSNNNRPNNHPILALV